MALTKEDLQAIRAVVKEEVLEQLGPVNRQLDVMQADMTHLKKDVSVLKEDVGQIKEDTAITREATNSLIAWADEVAVISQIKFPVKKVK